MKTNCASETPCFSTHKKEKATRNRQQELKKRLLHTQQGESYNREAEMLCVRESESSAASRFHLVLAHFPKAQKMVAFLGPHFGAGEPLFELFFWQVRASSAAAAALGPN